MAIATERKSAHSRRAQLRLGIGDVDVHVCSDCPELLDDLRRFYPSPGRGAESGRPIQIEVKARRTRLGNRRYAVYGDQQEITGLRRACEVFPFVEWGINLRLIATRPEYVQLHAASMALEGKGVIFAGGSGCGKSTLAAALLAGGWQYLCDEFALIERRTLRLHPFPKALCIKSGSFAPLEELGLPFARRKDHVKGQKGRVAYINPMSVRDDAIGTPCPVRAVVFPMYVGTKRPRCLEISPARALLELSGCVFNRHAFADQGMSILHRLVKGARCFRLETGDLTGTRGVLEAALQSAPNATEAISPERTDRPHAANFEEGRLTTSVSTRRQMLREGVKLAYVLPAVLTLPASHAFAATSNPSGLCSTGVHTGGLCQTDTDCCTGRCTVGVCE